MPLLETFDAISGHLGEALRGRTHYVFAADFDAGRRAVAGIALALGFAGVAEADVGLASFGHLSPRTGERTTVLVVTLRKAAVHPRAVPVMLGRYGLSQPVGDHQDVFAFAEPGRAERLAGVLDGIMAGDCWEGRPGVN